MRRIPVEKALHKKHPRITATRCNKYCRFCAAELHICELESTKSPPTPPSPPQSASATHSTLVWSSCASFCHDPQLSTMKRGRPSDERTRAQAHPERRKGIRCIDRFERSTETLPKQKKICSFECDRPEIQFLFPKIFRSLSTSSSYSPLRYNLVERGRQSQSLEAPKHLERRRQLPFNSVLSIESMLFVPWCLPELGLWSPSEA